MALQPVKLNFSDDIFTISQYWNCDQQQQKYMYASEHMRSSCCLSLRVRHLMKGYEFSAKKKKKRDIVYIISFQVTLTRKIQYFDIIWFIIHHTTHVNKYVSLFIMAYSMIHWSMPQGSLQNPSHFERYNLVISHTMCFYYSILQQYCYVVFFF